MFNIFDIFEYSIHSLQSESTMKRDSGLAVCLYTKFNIYIIVFVTILRPIRLCHDKRIRTNVAHIFEKHISIGLRMLRNNSTIVYCLNDICILTSSDWVLSIAKSKLSNQSKWPDWVSIIKIKIMYRLKCFTHLWEKHPVLTFQLAKSIAE